jgi:hypothetical protein
VRSALVLLVLALACRRSAPVRPDPVVVDAAPPKEPVAGARVLRQGRVIDRKEAIVVASLSEKAPVVEAHDERHGSFAERDGTIHELDLAAARELWRSKPAFGPPTWLVQTELGPVAARERDVVIFDHVGSARTLSFAKPVSHLISVGKDVLLLEDGEHLHRVDVAAGGATKLATLPFKTLGWMATLRAVGKNACAIAAPSTALEIACIDPAGATSTRVTLDLRKSGDPATSYTIRASGDRHVLYGTGPFFSKGIRRSAVVRLSDGAVVARLEDEAATFVERTDGSLDGVLVVLPELRLYEPSGALRWKAPAIHAHDECAAAVAHERRLFVDVYPSISSGSTLIALDDQTGATLWRGDVEALPIAHSEYFNEVRLSTFDGRVILRGDESSVLTYQLFDELTGKRALALSTHTW